VEQTQIQVVILELPELGCAITRGLSQLHDPDGPAEDLRPPQARLTDQRLVAPAISRKAVARISTARVWAEVDSVSRG
jgi:hypothetical protein